MPDGQFDHERRLATIDIFTAVASQTEGKQALARIEGQLAASQGGGGSYTALVVSAQALVVAVCMWTAPSLYLILTPLNVAIWGCARQVFLFYQRLAQRRRDHFL